MRYLLLCVLCLSLRSQAQTVLFSDDFESYTNFVPGGATTGWRSVTFTGSNNRWEVNNAACKISGNRSLMITNNGTTCTYNKNDNCDKIAYNATPFSTTGYGCLSLYCDISVTGGEVSGSFATDYLVIYYNTGAGWVSLTNAILQTGGTVSLALPLPAAVNNQASVYIGFDWVNDNSLGTDQPAVIDNIVIKGSNAAAPANNPCASASAITFTGTSAAIAGNNACATADIVNPTCYNTARNVWHTFVCPSSGNYYASVTCGSMTYPTFSILSFGTACNAASATQVGCGVYNGQSYASLSACSLVAGQTYYVMVDNYGNVGTYTLNIQKALSNDLITTPAAINSCGTTFTSSTIGATNCGDGNGSTTGNNVDNNASSGTFGSGGDVGFSVENSSWYNFCNASGASATYTITGTNLGACTGSNGIQFAYFTGSATTLSLQSGGTNGMNILSGNSFTSNAITLANGACAFVMVDGYAGTNCNYAISVSASPVCLILPLNIVYFKGFADNHENSIKWATANEADTKEFIIEKSPDGANFEILNKLPAAGNSRSLVNYELTDTSPFSNGTYYRLKLINRNGSLEFSNVIFVDQNMSYGKFELVSLSPNPATDIAMLKLSVPYKGQLKLEVFDKLGNAVFQKQQIAEPGILAESIRLIDLNPGVYFLKATFDNAIDVKTSLLIAK